MIKRNKKAFTLIELMVSVAIIAILATLSVPSFRKAIRNSRDGKRQSDVKNVAEALDMYWAEHNGNLPSNMSGLSDYVKVTPTAAVADYDYSYSYSESSYTQSYIYCARVENNDNGNSTSTSSITGPCSASATYCYYCIKGP